MLLATDTQLTVICHSNKRKVVQTAKPGIPGRASQAEGTAAKIRSPKETSEVEAGRASWGSGGTYRSSR